MFVFCNSDDIIDSSPRLGNLYSSSLIQVSSLGDPYGVISMSISGSSLVTEPGNIDLVVTRSGMVGRCHLFIESNRYHY